MEDMCWIRCQQDAGLLPHPEYAFDLFTDMDCQETPHRFRDLQHRHDKVLYHQPESGCSNDQQLSQAAVDDVLDLAHIPWFTFVSAKALCLLVATSTMRRWMRDVEALDPDPRSTRSTRWRARVVVAKSNGNYAMLHVRHCKQQFLEDQPGHFIPYCFLVVANGYLHPVLAEGLFQGSSDSEAAAAYGIERCSCCSGYQFHAPDEAFLAKGRRGRRARQHARQNWIEDKLGETIFDSRPRDAVNAAQKKTIPKVASPRDFDMFGEDLLIQCYPRALCKWVLTLPSQCDLSADALLAVAELERISFFGPIPEASTCALLVHESLLVRWHRQLASFTGPSDTWVGRVVVAKKDGAIVLLHVYHVKGLNDTPIHHDFQASASGMRHPVVPQSCFEERWYDQQGRRAEVATLPIPPLKSEAKLATRGTHVKVSNINIEKLRATWHLRPDASERMARIATKLDRLNRLEADTPKSCETVPQSDKKQRRAKAWKDRNAKQETSPSIATSTASASGTPSRTPSGSPCGTPLPLKKPLDLSTIEAQVQRENEGARLRKAARKKSAVVAELQQNQPDFQERVSEEEAPQLSKRTMKRRAQQARLQHEQRARGSKQQEEAGREFLKIQEAMLNLQSEARIHEQKPKQKQVRNRRSGRGPPSQLELEVAGSLSLTGTMRGLMRQQLLAFIKQCDGLVLVPDGERFVSCLIKDLLDGVHPAVDLEAAAAVFSPFADAYLNHHWASDMAGRHLGASEREPILRCAAAS